MKGARMNPAEWIGADRRMTTFGEIIKAAREAKGLKQREVAVQVEPHLQGAHVWRWEAGRNFPTAERLARLIDILELDPDEIWRIWGESQVPDREAAIANAVTPVERAVAPAPRNEAAEGRPAPARAPRARRDILPSDS